MLPIYRKLDIHVLIENVLASWLLTFWSECVINFHSFAHDDTSTAVHLISPYHPNQRPWECCYPLGSFVLAASHPIPKAFGTIDACAGRLLMMEHEVKSFFSNQRAFNSYSDSLVSHFALQVTSIYTDIYSAFAPKSRYKAEVLSSLFLLLITLLWFFIFLTV